jgi:polysaccharide biosynthesis transport protein
MSLSQFWRILWARKLIVIVTALFCLAGGVVAILIVPPRWKAESHVYLNLLKADPVTGEYMGTAARAYVATQIKLMSDYSVAGLAVDKLGWLSDPDLIAQYQRRPQSDTRDFRRWLAQRIMDGTRADLLDGSNILDISYTGQSPEGAKAIVAAVTQAYLDTTLTFRRSEANKNADWYGLQSDKAKQSLLAAQAAVATYERENGIVMRDDKTDVDSARLAALASQNDVAAVGGISGLDAQIAEVDSAIKQASETLGPNHPQLVALREKRASLMALAAQAGSPQVGGGMSARVAAAKEAVIGNRDKLARLTVLQSEVDIRKDQYDKTLAREADFRQQAAVVDPGVSALGTAFVPDQPSFPNKPLIIGGSLGLGLVFGLLIALLVELLDRRVRSPEDLSAALGLPVLAVLRPAG